MKHKQGRLLITIGLLLLAAALAITLSNLKEDTRAGETAESLVLRLKEEIFPEASAPETTPGESTEGEILPGETGETGEDGPGETEIPDYILDPKREMPVKTVDGDDYLGLLEIPDLGLELPIMAQWSYALLEKAPCRYGGSAYTGDLIIAGHNYASHFRHLGELSLGAQIRFWDVDGNLFCYEVAEMETLRATAVEDMEAGDWDLSLFTCTVGGQNRLTLRCVLMEE